MADLVAAGDAMLAPYQPSQRYYLLDAARTSDADLPPDNLVSALVGLEKARDAARLGGALKPLIDLLRAAGDDHLTRAFAAWLREGLWLAGRPTADGREPLAELQETQTMLEENVQEWTREWIEEGRAQGIEGGRAQGIEQGRDEERALLCRLAARKFDAAAAEGLAAALAGVADGSRTRSGSGGSATGSSSAGRPRSFSPASVATSGRAV